MGVVAVKKVVALAAMKKVMGAKRVTKVARGKFAKAVVLRGNKEKTQSGLTADMLTRSKSGKIVSKKSHALGLKRYNQIKSWNESVSAARKALGVTGWVAINGKTSAGRALYAKVKALYAAKKK